MAFLSTELINNDLQLHNKYGIYSKYELENQLKEGHLTIKEIAEIYGLKDYQMVHVFRTLGIVYRNNLNDTRVFSSEISPDMHQMLLGTLAGDAFMKNPKCYQLAHGINQVSYLYHCANVIAPFVSTVGYKESDKGNSFFMWTNRHSAFIPYFQRFYSHGKNKKFFTEESLYDLDARGLAYWWQDDGKHHDYGAYLCVGKITAEEGTVLIKLLERNFNINSTFQVQHEKKQHYNIYIKAESRNHFFSLIKPFVIPLMEYKEIGGSISKVPFNATDINILHEHLCERAARAVNFSGRTDITTNVTGFKQDFIKQLQGSLALGLQVSHSEDNVRQDQRKSSRRGL